MRPKNCGLIFASHSSTASPLGFGKDILSLQVGKPGCDKNQSFTDNPSAVATGKIVDYVSEGCSSRPVAGDRFFYESQFRRCSVSSYKIFSVDSPFWSLASKLSFRAQTAVLLLSTSSPWFHDKAVSLESPSIFDSLP